MKKQVTTAMAAAMAFGAVTPAFADQVQTRSLVEEDGAVQVDVRTANGLDIVSPTTGSTTAFTRAQAYNTNFTADLKDDTLKDSSWKVVKEIASGDKTTKAEYLYVLAKDAKASDVNVAKAIVEAAKAELKAYYEAVDHSGKKKYKVEVNEVRTQITTTGSSVVKDTLTQVVVTDTKGKEVKTYNFNGVAEVTSEELAELFTGIEGKMPFAKDQTAADYFNLNAFKYVVEQNADKFDIVKNEKDNKTLEVKVYAKGADKEEKDLFTMTLENVVLTGDDATVDTDLVIDMPAKTDIDGHWAEKEIKTAMLKGQIDASANFRAKDGITRAEFAKIVCTMFDIPTDEKSLASKEEPFHDVNKDAWYYEYVVALYNYEGQVTGTTAGTVINGYGDDFRPNAEITRQEAAKMMAAAYELKHKTALNGGNKDVVHTADGVVDTTVEVNKEEIHVDVKTKFTDDAEIKTWADESVNALKAVGVINGNPDGTFKPASNINRAEALLMISRAATKTAE